jgi:hypothetical protein
MDRRALPLLAGALIALALASVASGEVAQRGGVRVAVQAKLAPSKLPRDGAAPVSVTFAGRITPTSPIALPQLEAIAIALNSHGKLLTQGLPRCRLGRIDPSTTA